MIEQWMLPATSTDFESRLAYQLVRAFQEQLRQVPTEPEFTPHLLLHLRMDVASALNQPLHLISEVALELYQSARESGIPLRIPPKIDLVVDESPGEDLFRVESAPLPDETGHTAVLQTARDLPPEDIPPKRAFLLVNGKDLFYLDATVINIGRRPENHLVIPDLRVSREHAQIRFSRGQYILFDLNSTGGTTVNGQPVRQWPLKPGDVISLAGVPMIFGIEAYHAEDNSDTGKTISMRDSPGEEPS
ncbi:protein containing FOG: FHA domain [Anaerolinea thermolimosa]|nr:protein containing FOG: FHA domain [Anaerolinea thermolimosa]